MPVGHLYVIFEKLSVHLGSYSLYLKMGHGDFYYLKVRRKFFDQDSNIPNILHAWVVQAAF